VTELNPALLPPDLALHDDDVVEAVEVVAEPDDEDDGADGGPGSPEVRVSGFDGIGTRREARERALALLYEAEQRLIAPPAALIDQLPVPPEAFAGELVVGVSDHLEEIDDLLRRYSVSWPLERMPAIDRALLRLGTYELVFTDVPVGACISEAVELAKRYSTDESHKFVNGMLARVADEVRSGR
jgi:N utilization substance protein B